MEDTPRATSTGQNVVGRYRGHSENYGLDARSRLHPCGAPIGLPDLAGFGDIELDAALIVELLGLGNVEIGHGDLARDLV
jgi:hypothetical protein